MPKAGSLPSAARKDGTGNWWFLNFDHTEGPTRTDATWGVANTDGDDVLFGDLGNDWSVGGTGKDTLWLGWGNDLGNADDVLTTGVPIAGRSNPRQIQPSPNDTPDTHPSYEDRVYGGAGLDILIGNTGGDRLIDWVGEFNSYIVPFAAFGIATVSRQVTPALYDFLYALAAGQGADPTRAGDTGNEAARKGEPDGEIGLITQKDSGLWQGQTGSPSDPQPGNIPGGRGDVLRSADFNDGQAQGFVPDSGTWTVTGGRFQVAPTTLGSDAASVYYVDQYIPKYFEITATINAVKPTAGFNANSYVIFDYQSPTDFKFAGVNVATNKLELGHRNAQGWIVDSQGVVPGQVKSDTDYNIFLSVNGLLATVIVNNQTSLTFSFAPRVDADGYQHFLNEGLVGIGANNAKAQIDNVFVQRLPETIAYSSTDDFADGVADLFTGQKLGQWQVTAGRYDAAPAAGADRAVSLTSVRATTLSLLELTTTVRTQAIGGIIFDDYGPSDFKFAAISATTNQVIIGHYTDRKGWVVDAAASRTILAGTDYQLSVSLKGTAVNISINGQVALAFSFNGAVVDGSFGLLSRNGSSSFDAVTVEAGELATSTPGGNGAPLATNDNGRTNPNTPLIIAVLANDSDANGDALTVTALTQPTSGTAVLNPIGTVTYTPNAGFTGTDTFTYKASDGTNESNVIYANTTAQSITDGGVLTSTIAISDSFTIADINVTLDITHTRDSDLQIFLRGPDGTVIQLFNGKGVSGQNLRNTVFDDEAATSITAASAPFTGTFRPLQSLSALDGKLAAGTWTLEVHDTVKKQTGTLNSWSLGITG